MKTSSIIALGAASYLGYKAWNELQSVKNLQSYKDQTLPVVRQSMIDNNNMTAASFAGGAAALLLVTYLSSINR